MTNKKLGNMAVSNMDVIESHPETIWTMREIATPLPSDKVVQQVKAEMVKMQERLADSMSITNLTHSHSDPHVHTASPHCHADKTYVDSQIKINKPSLNFNSSFKFADLHEQEHMLTTTGKGDDGQMLQWNGSHRVWTTVNPLAKEVNELRLAVEILNDQIADLQKQVGSQKNIKSHSLEGVIEESADSAYDRAMGILE